MNNSAEHHVWIGEICIGGVLPTLLHVAIRMAKQKVAKKKVPIDPETRRA